MSFFNSSMDVELHKRLAMDLFNYTWELMEKSDRSVMEDDEMAHAAHASRFHWGIAGTPLNFIRGEWQISRVYAILGRSEPALQHGKRCLELCLNHAVGDFDLAFAYESLARASALQGDEGEREKYLELAKNTGQNIEKEEDRKWFFDNLNDIVKGGIV